MRLFVVLPAYNESQNLPQLLEQLSAPGPSSLGLNVVLVDDGSTDGTAQAAEKSRGGLALTVLKHPRNLGLASALRTGLHHVLAEASDEDAVAVLDADNTHPPALLAALKAKLEEGYDAVIASRYAPGGLELGLAPHRRFLSRACSLLLQGVFRVKGVSDFTCGYRLIRARALREVSRSTGGALFTEQGFACSAELLLRLWKSGARFAEVPLRLRYDLKKGKSKMRVLATVWRTLALAGRMRLGG